MHVLTATDRMRLLMMADPDDEDEIEEATTAAGNALVRSCS